ncbi:putative arp2 3 complex 21 kda subunit [Paratrimastix pyriformis]|uniref:Actin-related protein 2/3 complex subunit 3 n=1 Tax=Paratrimastix pyriformis TaxID=342808 RepID=A0ABQ8UT04_9EUKA|nr:putative arp2 3 complex 21 kda subunit [Paratrimastix pyriformis]
MPPFHSIFNQNEKEPPKYPMACGMPILPLRASAQRGPAPVNAIEQDIVDEAINYYRANVLFRNFDLKGAADKVLIYLTLFITQALQRARPTKQECANTWSSLAIESFVLPGDGSFALAGYITAPAQQRELDTIRLYLQQLRAEVCVRLLEKIYPAPVPASPTSSAQVTFPDFRVSHPSKWWLQFAKHRFLNKAL